jgi:putative ATP-dependent endonuclease of OLD family
MNVLGRDGSRCEAFQPTEGLDPDLVGNVERYLDAVRSNLLFAKSVVLVEGDAEEILVPILVKKVLGVSLDELGVSLVNIRSTGFKNVAALFHGLRIRKRCSIVTDHDVSVIDTTPVAGDPDALRKFKEKCLGSQESGAARKTDLEAFAAGNPWVKAFYATHTFEVDFVAAGNADKAIGILGGVYAKPATITKATAELSSPLVAYYGTRVLRMAANMGKGWFAILLGKNVDHRTALPEYLVRAVAFARPDLSAEVWCNVLEYRLYYLLKDGLATAAKVSSFKHAVNEYRAGRKDFPGIRSEFLAEFPNDRINAVLSAF